MSTEITGHEIISTGLFEQRSLQELVDIYNSLSENPVESFPNRVAATTAILGLLAVEQSQIIKRHALRITSRKRKVQSDPERKYDYEAASVARAPRAGSISSQIADLLREGATHDDISETLGISLYNAKRYSARLARCFGYGIRQQADGKLYLVVPENGEV